jgi:hypothetical protein
MTETEIRKQQDALYRACKGFMAEYERAEISEVNLKWVYLFSKRLARRDDGGEN